MIARVSSESSEPAVGLAGDRRERVDPHVDHELAPDEARDVRAHVRLEARLLQRAAQRAELLVLPSDMQMCVGPFPACRMRPGPRNVAPWEVTPAAVRSAPKCGGDDRLVAQPVLQGEHDGPWAGQGGELGRGLLGGRGLHEDDQHVRAARGPGIGAGPRPRGGHGTARRLLDGQPVTLYLLHVLPEDVVEHDIESGEGELPPNREPMAPEPMMQILMPVRVAGRCSASPVRPSSVRVAVLDA